MVAIDPNAATPEEKEAGITKLRYMKVPTSTVFADL